MSTEKRERQRENRRRRLAARDAAAKRYATRRRVKLIGSAAVAVAAVLAVLAFLQRGNDEETTTADVSDSTATESPTEPTETPETPETPQDELLEGDLPGEDLPGEDPQEDQEGGTEEDAAAAPSGKAVPEGCPEPDGASGRVIDFDEPQPMCIDPESAYTAVFDTTEGEIRFDLTAEATPITVNNFVTLARWGYYDGTLLFRTDPSIDIIQGGSPHTNSASDPGPGYNIVDEPAFDADPETGALTGPYRYLPGQLVMARSAGPDSASAQFFITTGPNTALLDSQGTYVVFGQTDAAGLEVAQSIIGLHVDTGNMGGAPSRDVTVRSVTIEETPTG